MSLAYTILALCGIALAAAVAYLGRWVRDRIRWRRRERQRFDRDLESYRPQRRAGNLPPEVIAKDARVSAALRQLIAGGSKDSAAAMLRLPTAAAACADTAEWCAVTEDILRKHGWRP